MTPPEGEYDVVVVGSGAGGLTAAIVAAQRGASVLVVEKADRLGGTTARSGARLWIPGNRHAAAHGIADTLESARQYLRHEAAEDFDPALVDAFLAAGPAMVEFLETHTAVRFLLDTTHSPDYSPHAPGAARGGRTIYPAELATAEIGEAFARIAPFRRWGTFFGIQVGAGADSAHFMKATRSLRSFAFVAREMAVQAASFLRHRRLAVLRDGNALVGRLLMSAEALGVAFMPRTAALELIVDDGSVRGVRVHTADRIVDLRARRAVVLASGGVGHNPLLRRRMFDHVRAGAPHRSAAAPGVTGDGIGMALQAGAALRVFSRHKTGAWAPMFSDPRDPTTDANVPSFVRAVPGTVVVSRKGTRIGNEAEYYPDFTLNMFRHHVETGDAECFLVGDSRALRRYGLGTAVVRPFPFPVRPHLRSGLLIRGQDLGELATRCGIDRAGLEATVAAMNTYARSGRDLEFGRGETPLEPRRSKNPFLGRIDSPPYYAVRLVPGDIGSFAGIRTDALARVLRDDGSAIPGLYAVGNDMASAFGGDYPGKGGTIGPAMTFAFIAGRHGTAGS